MDLHLVIQIARLKKMGWDQVREAKEVVRTAEVEVVVWVQDQVIQTQQPLASISQADGSLTPWMGTTSMLTSKKPVHWINAYPMPLHSGTITITLGRHASRAAGQRSQIQMPLAFAETVTLA